VGGGGCGGSGKHFGRACLGARQSQRRAERRDILTLVNSGADADRLVGASSPVAENIQIHEEKTEDGVSKMRQLEVIEVPPGSTVMLKPSGIHLMMKLKQQLQEGQTFPLTLTFEKTGAVEVTGKVGKVGAMDDMSGM